MSTAQSFLFFLIALGAVATTLRLVSRSTPTGIGFWNLLAFVLNAILFLMVGIALPTQRLVAVAGLALGAYVMMLAARAIPVYTLLGLADIRGSSIPWSWRHMTFWGGMRGALSVALALSVAAYPQVNPQVSVIAYGMVVLSLIVQGGLLLPVGELLRLRSRPAEVPVV
jgi:CPA1 family monovalent cation:H+ antiporter